MKNVCNRLSHYESISKVNDDINWAEKNLNPKPLYYPEGCVLAVEAQLDGQTLHISSKRVSIITTGIKMAEEWGKANRASNEIHQLPCSDFWMAPILKE